MENEEIFNLKNNKYMNYYIENELPKINVNSKIEFTFKRNWSNEIVHTIVGLSNYGRYKDEQWLTFLIDNNDTFGNGYKFRNVEQVLESIRNRIKNDISKNEDFISKLKIDNKEIILFQKIN